MRGPDFFSFLIARGPDLNPHMHYYCFFLFLSHTQTFIPNSISLSLSLSLSSFFYLRACLTTLSPFTHNLTPKCTSTSHFLYIKSGNVATVLRHCALSVFALCEHCSGNSALVRHLFFQLRFFFFWVFHLYFFFSFIYIVLLHNKFHNIFTIIEVSISNKSK